MVWKGAARLAGHVASNAFRNARHRAMMGMLRASPRAAEKFSHRQKQMEAINEKQSAEYAKQVAESNKAAQSHRLSRPIVSEAELKARQNELMKELLKVFPPNFQKVDRNKLDARYKEIYDLHTLFVNAVANGEITGLAQFKGYLKNWLAKHQQNPQYAETAMKKFVRSFRGDKFKELEMIGRKFEMVRKGIDPHDEGLFSMAQNWKN